MTVVRDGETQADAGRSSPAAEALRVVCSEATCTVATASLALGISERLVREAVANGDVAALRLGRNIRVLCAPLRRQLGMEG